MNRDPEAWTRLGRLIRDARELRGVSREGLAELAEVSAKSVFSAEVGYGKNPPLRQQPPTLVKIVTALGWEPSSIQIVLDGGSPIPVETSRAGPAAPSKSADRGQLFTDPRAQAIWELDLPVEERLQGIRDLMDAQHRRAKEELRRATEEAERRRRAG